MSKTLYIGNLPWRTSAEELIGFFSSYGEVLDSRVIIDRETGRSRGFGFVEVDDADCAKIVEAVNGTEFNGRVLTVNEARARS